MFVVLVCMGDFCPIFRGHGMCMLALLMVLSEQCSVCVSCMCGVVAERVCSPGSHANVAVLVVLVIFSPSSSRPY